MKIAKSLAELKSILGKQDKHNLKSDQCSRYEEVLQG